MRSHCHYSHRPIPNPSHRIGVDSCPSDLASYSFLDINPLSKGHALVIPKCSFSLSMSPAVLNVSPVTLSLSSISPDHAEKMHELPDEYLADALPIAKKIAIAQGAENYNILQVRVTLFCEPQFFLSLSPSSPRPPSPICSAAIWIVF